MSRGSVRKSPKRFSVALVVGLLISAAQSAEALCLSSPDMVDKREPVRFMESVIDSLLWAKKASARVRPDDSGIPQLLALHHRRQDYQCAAKRLEPFTQSRDQIMVLAATTLTEYYGLLGDLNEDAISWTTLASSVTPGVLLKQLESIKRLKDTTEVSLVAAVAQTPYALVQWGPNGEATGRLSINAVERRQLLGLLEQSFGPGVKGLNPGTVDPWETAGRLIYKVLTDHKWKSADLVKRNGGYFGLIANSAHQP